MTESSSERGPSNIDPRIIRAWHHALPKDAPIELVSWIQGHYLNVTSESAPGVVSMSDDMIERFEEATGIYHLPADVIKERLQSGGSA